MHISTIQTAPESPKGNYLHDWLLIHTCLTISMSLWTVANHLKGEHVEGYKRSPYDQRCKKVSSCSGVSFGPMKETNEMENYAEAVVPRSQQQNSCGDQWGKKMSSVLRIHGLAADLFCDHGMHLKATVFKAA